VLGVVFSAYVCGILNAKGYSDPREYLSHIMKATNMSCLTPEGALSGDCDFLSANMYARSLFGKFVLILKFALPVWNEPLIVRIFK
jgi:Coatomer beta subunit appendage platform